MRTPDLAVLVVYLLGCVSKRVTASQAAIATVLGVATVAWIVFFQKTFHGNLSIVFGTVVLFVSGIVLSFTCRRCGGLSGQKER